MPYAESTLNASDGLSLFVRTWTPDQPPRAVLVIVHGLGEHAERYPHVISAFLPRGYVIYGHDHRGYGRSGGKRGDFPAFEQLQADLDQVVETARRANPGLPVFLYAHSLGGMYATHYLARHEKKIRAALLSAPGYGPGPDFSPNRIRLARVLSRLAPNLTIKSSSEPVYNLSQDPESKKAWEADALRHDFVTVRFAWTNLQKATEAQGLLAKLTLPVLLILGDMDTTINRQAILDAAAHAGPNVTFRRYPCLHELHNELPELREVVLEEAGEWFEGMLA